MDLVSIIIPVYNVEQYLIECLESVISQTYSNLEIIVVDDGSTDSSSKICDEYAEKDGRIKVYHKKNTGLGLTRNFGLEYAKGKFVIFFDSDDYVENNIVENMLNEQRRENADTVIVGYTKVSQEGVIIFDERYSRTVYEDSDVTNKFLPRMIGSLPDVKDSIFKSSCARLYSREIIEKNMLRFPSEREYQGEDCIFQFDYFSFSKKVVVSSFGGYFYRINNMSLTRSYKANRFDESLKMVKYVEGKIKEMQLPQDSFLRLCKMLFVSVLGAIVQEIPNRNQKTRKECVNTIRKIVNDEMVVKCIGCYPIKKLTFKQRIFLYLLKYKMVLMLYVYSLLVYKRNS